MFWFGARGCLLPGAPWFFPVFLWYWPLLAFLAARKESKQGKQARKASKESKQGKQASKESGLHTASLQVFSSWADPE
jgi:hypothetical protein